MKSTVMKRTAEGVTTSPFHPALAFHREVLTVQAWAQLRRDFLGALQACSAAGRIEWREPRKLWRHSQEALGKWLLSQLARVPACYSNRDPALPDTHDLLQDDATTSRPASSSSVMLGMFSFAAPHIKAPAQQDTSYDEQLIRDLVLKCHTAPGKEESDVVHVIQELVRDFQLMSRCSEALAAIETAMQHVTPQTACQPQLRRISADDTRRTPSQQRMCGAIAEIAVRWPAGGRSNSTTRSGCTPVSIPWVAYEKLLRCYAAFGAKADAAYCTPAFTLETCELCRVATVALRYEGGLATGSLQLCADTALKQHVHGVGYHVMDLCASPINAYMGRPRQGLSHHRRRNASTQHEHAETDSVSNEATEEGEPNWFCSAFVDTDGYFGSLGSALHVDPLRLRRSALVNPTHAPLLLTLDVPYDEDLCQQLFCKLAEDMQRAEKSSHSEVGDTPHAGQAEEVSGVGVDYILVLPLWWDLQLDKPKRLFTSENNGEKEAVSVLSGVTHGKVAGDESGTHDGGKPSEALDRLLRERTAPLQQGHVIHYDWPVRLARASRGWVCFDGVFVGDSYTYFCTATNRALRGVTTTEVIGLSQPRKSATMKAEESMLSAALRTFYD